jgi:hypothetical protein
MITIAQYNPHTYTYWAPWAIYQFQIIHGGESTVWHPNNKRTIPDRATNTILIYKGQ